MAWKYNIDGDKVNDDWHHTPDGDYEPKGITYTQGDYEMRLPNGELTSREELKRIRKDAKASIGEP